MAQRKVVVIGGNGQLGSAATRGALDSGALVTVMSRRARQQDPGTVAVKGSITAIDDLREVLTAADAVIVSVEADWTPSGLRSVYVDGMKNVLAATSADTHIVFMGNIGVTDDSRMPDYNRAKRDAEELLRRSGKKYTILRPAWIVSGPTGAKLEQGDRYTGRRDDVSDGQLAQAIRAILTHSEEANGKTFELYGGSQDLDWPTALKTLNPDK
jgi:uncharacterized protein YbjT (DUF2867 family)